jgi:glycosyltransferase involved in cell wall biosynthesis
MEDRLHVPVVSIILPTFNRAPVIDRAIHSALHQTFIDFELIVVDDASTDGTLELLAAIPDPRLRVIQHVENRGGSAARNTGIAEARGKYITFLDSDDKWHPDKLEKELAIMEGEPENVGVVYSGFWRHVNGKKSFVPFNWVKKKEGDIHEQLLWRNFINTQSLIRKNCFEVVGIFDEKAPKFQDWDLFLRISKRFNFAYTGEPLFDVFHSEKSITSNPEVQISGLEYILRKHCADFSLHKEILAEQYYQLSLLYYRGGDRTKAKKLLKRAMKLNRFNFKFLLTYCLSLSGRIMQFVFNIYKSFKNER